ncbi:MAG: hypothetical protein IT243_03650 [Bacteroidia bacterium]|nr:hypothetical protein [Bacteroidia bacterium]
MGITSNYEWVCPIGNGLVFSEIGNYKLYYYSISENKIIQMDTNIIFNPPQLKSKLKHLQKKYQLDPRTSILTDSLSKFEEVYGYISELVPINDSIFCVYYSKVENGEKKYYIDSWKLSYNRFMLINSTLNHFYCDKDKLNSKISNDFQPLWFNIKKFSTQNSLYIFTFFPINFNPIGLKYQVLCEKAKNSKFSQVIFKYSIHQL